MHRRLRLRLRSKNEQICIARRVTSYLAGRMTDAQNDRYMLVVLRLKQGENIHRMGRWYQAARRTRCMPLVQVPDKMARRGSHRPTQSKSKLDTSFYIFAKVLYALYVVLTCIRCIVSQLQARPHRWASAPELHCSQNEIWRHPVFFLNSLKIMKNMHTGSKNDHFYLFIRNNGCQKRVLKKKLKAYISKYFRQTKLPPGGNFHISGSPFYTVLTSLSSIRARKFSF